MLLEETHNTEIENTTPHIQIVFMKLQSFFEVLCGILVSITFYWNSENGKSAKHVPRLPHTHTHKPQM
jgi:hypothetical protein